MKMSNKPNKRYVKKSHGTIKVGEDDRERIIEMTPQMRDNFLAQNQAFKKKFGRSPQPNDPVFFDPDSDIPIPINEEKMNAVLLAAMKKAGISPEFIYAYEQTGLLLTESNIHNALPEDVRDWKNAIREYRVKYDH
jgi:hypothetical protein